MLPEQAAPPDAAPNLPKVCTAAPRQLDLGRGSEGHPRVYCCSCGTGQKALSALTLITEEPHPGIFSTVKTHLYLCRSRGF